MADTNALPNRQWELIITSAVFLVLGSVFTIWRLIIRQKVSRWLGPSDWLMLFGVLVNNVDCVINILAGFAGAGRLQRDPFLTITQRVELQRYLFIGQILNIYAMFLVKLSICLYLLALNFSKLYRRMIWGTLVFVVVFNFLLPSVSFWGLCRPLAARWDTRITDKVCWPIVVRRAFGYMQSVSNILTDIMYATAPIVYLKEVQLRKRTQWGVRAVFVMSLVCTTVSALKIWDQERHKNTRELIRDVVPMTLWATAENTVGIVVANLPLLRKPFEKLFKSLLGSTRAGTTNATVSNDHYNSFMMQSHLSQGARKSRSMGNTGYTMKSLSEGDDQSDKAILEDLDKPERRQGPFSGIMKTTRVTVHQDGMGEHPDSRGGR